MDLTGQTFSRLTVTGKGDGRYKWQCVCVCGGTAVRSTSQLRDKTHGLKSCGCARRESIARASAAAWKVTTKFQHPHKLKLKVMLGNMLKRCHVPGSNRWERYGGRGIQVCEAWRKNHTAFFEWAAANGYREGLSIERIDRDGNYTPENCRFVTMKEQANNTSRNRFLSWLGETLTVSQWAERLGVKPKSVQHRVDRGWTVERIFTQPFRSR